MTHTTYIHENTLIADTTVIPPAYVINQRLVGYANNDGRYTVERVAPAMWTMHGTLVVAGQSKFIGVFDTEADADAAAAADLTEWWTLDKTPRPVR